MQRLLILILAFLTPVLCDLFPIRDPYGNLQLNIPNATVDEFTTPGLATLQHQLSFASTLLHYWEGVITQEDAIQRLCWLHDRRAMYCDKHCMKQYNYTHCLTDDGELFRTEEYGDCPVDQLLEDINVSF